MKISNVNFYDGKISVKRNASVEILGESIIIYIEGDTRSYRWNLDTVEILDKPIDGRPAVLGCNKMPHARLIIPHISDFKEISRYIKIPNWWQTSGVFTRNIVAFIAILSLVVIFVVPYWTKLVVPIVPKEWESKLGDEAKSLIIGESKICSSINGKKALEKIIVNLTDEIPDYYFKIQVLQKDSSNAISLPGGNIIIFSKLIDESKTQEELIGVIAHEIAHIKYRHGLENIINTLASGFIIDVFTGGGGTILYLANQYKSLSFSREKEKKADLYAIKLLERKKINVDGMVNFFSKTDKTKKKNSVSDSLPSYLSTHPTSKERVDLIEKYRQNSRREYSSLLTKQEWKNIKHICD